jgi:hypothetical protein
MGGGRELSRLLYCTIYYCLPVLTYSQFLRCSSGSAAAVQRERETFTCSAVQCSGRDVVGAFPLALPGSFPVASPHGMCLPLFAFRASRIAARRPPPAQNHRTIPLLHCHYTPISPLLCSAIALLLDARRPLQLHCRLSLPSTMPPRESS